MDSYEQLPEDLREIGERLTSARVTPTPLELDALSLRVRARADAGAVSRRRARYLAARRPHLVARLLPLLLVATVGVALLVAGHSAVGAGGGKDTTIGFLNSAQLTSQQSASCSQYGGCCPFGTKLNFQWHYSDYGSSGSWSGTTSVTGPGSVSEGPQDMEGDQKVAPGTTVSVGYEFNIPGSHAPVTITVSNARVTFIVNCVTGSPTIHSFTATMPDATYAVNDSSWHPGFAYLGSVTVPNACHGGLVRLNQGGTFTATVS